MVTCETKVDYSVVHVAQFFGPTSYGNYFAERRSFVEGTGRCRDGQEQDTRWTNSGQEIGPLVCTALSDGTFRMAWGFDDSSIAAVKEGADLIADFKWWKDHAYLLYR